MSVFRMACSLFGLRDASALPAILPLVADWQTLARRAAQQEGIPPNLFVALVRQESGGRPGAVSPAGALGYTQLMPDTARSLGVNPRDPWQNLLGGAKYLKQQLHTFGGSVPKALAAYNAGPGAVQKYGGIPPYTETQNYVRSILGSVGHIGPVGSSGGGGGGGGGNAAPAATGAPGASVTPDSGGVDVSALLAALQHQRPAPASAGLQSPSFSAHPALPAGYQSLASSSPPTPPVDVQSLLAMVQTQPDSGQTGAVSPAGAPQTPSGGHGGTSGPMGASGAKIARFDGKPVAGWIAPILQRARATGLWKGTVSSGYRTDAEQTRIYNSGVRPAAVPRSLGGSGSNHEGAVFPLGAVDVSDPQGLAAALRKLGVNRLQYAGSKDPVHFSHPHNGGY